MRRNDIKRKDRDQNRREENDYNKVCRPASYKKMLEIDNLMMHRSMDEYEKRTDAARP